VKRNIEAVLTGFTPAPDVLSKKYGPVTALVYGIIWRFSQMDDEVCRASIERIASELGTSKHTVERRIKTLEYDGYVKDLTPTRRNMPHEYIPTGKLEMRMWVGMVENGYAKMAHRYAKMAQEESTTKADTANSIYSMYEANIGPLTPMIADALQDAEETYLQGWIEEAIALSVANNKRNWRYCETILKRWQADGKDDGKSKPKPTGKEAYNEALRKAGYEV
jgi:DnaD/phage-associated family protein